MSQPSTNTNCNYNLSLDIKRMMDIKEGWPLKLDSERQAILTKYIDEQQIEEGFEFTNYHVAEISKLLFGERKTGVVITGLPKSGKTFVLDQIIGSSPVSSPGIGLVQVQPKDSLLANHNFFNIDSGVPLNNEAIEKERDCLIHEGKFIFPDPDGFSDFSRFRQVLERVREKLEEKAITLATLNKNYMEQFISDMGFDLGHVFVVVSNNMNWNDQQNVKAMYEKLGEFKRRALYSNTPQKHSKLLIVHNFKDVDCDSADFEKMKKEFVTSCFIGKTHSHSVTINGVETREIEIFESSYPARAMHFFIGRDTTGNSNKYYFEKLKEQIALEIDQSLESPLLTYLMSRIKTNLRKYFLNTNDIKMKLTTGGMLTLYHPENLKLIPKDNNFMSNNIQFKPDMDVLLTPQAAYILVDCPGMNFVPFTRSLVLENNQFTVQIVRQRTIMVRGKRSLVLFKAAENGKIDTTTEMETYLSETEPCTEFAEDTTWPVNSRGYGCFENVWEVCLEEYDTRKLDYAEASPGVLQIVLPRFDDDADEYSS